MESFEMDNYSHHCLQECQKGLYGYKPIHVCTQAAYC